MRERIAQLMIGMVVSTIGLSGTGCGKASKAEHRKACGKYADLMVQSALDLRLADVPAETRASQETEVRAEFERDGLHKGYVDRCLLETKGAKKSFVSCIDGASGITDAKRCVDNQKAAAKRDEERKAKKNKKQDKDKKR